MMARDYHAALDEVLCEVLEKQAFLFPDKTPADALPKQAGNMLFAHIKFSGSVAKGELGFYAPEDMCREIAANFLGVDDDATEAATQAADALKEILNMVCGNFLTALAGGSVIFDLSVPAAQVVSQEDWAAVLARPDALCYTSDDYAIVCTLSIEE
jgi:CheY-specific phosphatase CheX